MFCSRNVDWIFRLSSNFTWQSPWKYQKDVVCRDKDGTVRLIVEASGRFTVLADYAWNGCSPKLCFFDMTIGTPDGVVDEVTGKPKTYYASCVHDALYQFKDAGSPVSQQQADRAFLMLMEETRFRLRWVYWLAVRALGWVVWKAQKRLRQLDGQVDSIDQPEAWLGPEQELGS